MSHLVRSMIAPALVFGLAGAPAAAQSWVETRTVRVAYDDLDTSSPAGAKTLLRRMKAATLKVCGTAPSHMLIKETLRHKACVDSAMSRAVIEANIPQVAALFAGSSEGSTNAQTAVR